MKHTKGSYYFMYMYNVLVNWLGKNQLKHDPIHYYEWRENDPIEKLLQTKVIYVSPRLFNAIYYAEIALPTSIKKQIYNESYIIRFGEKIIYSYACIIMDKERTCAINWGEEKGYFISQLLPHQERYILEHMQTVQKKKKHLLYFPIWKKRTIYADTRGLTRLEKEKRALLLIICKQMYEQACDKELMYWLKEWYYEKNISIENNRSSHLLWKELYQILKNGWTTNHETFFKKVSSYYYDKQIGITPVSINRLTIKERKKCYNKHHSTE